ncbi:MAG: alpha/beta fold hydrolase [Novosphingobium sp.]|nr:alpha/beta fold hydrolase [Novosphingobium sp.]
MRFVLVHGTSHGSWCWERVIPELERLGHEAIAIELPGHGERVDELPDGFASRSACVSDLLQAGDVLVGHSAGGYDITIAADRVPGKIGHLIYLAAGLPLEGRPIAEAMHGVHERDPETGEPINIMPDPEVLRHFGQDESGRVIWTSSEGPRAFFYQDCDAATVDWAYARLTPAVDVFPEEIISVPNFWKADLPRSYILCTQDRVISPVRAGLAAKRLGVEPLLIEASHSPFLSKPSELAEMFVRATQTEVVGPLIPC